MFCTIGLGKDALMYVNKIYNRMLTISVIDCFGDIWHTLNRLTLHYDEKLKGELFNLQNVEIPRHIDVIWHRANSVEQTRMDNLSHILTYIIPENLAGVESDNKWNNACLNFFKNLPSDTILLLYWHSI